MKINTLGIVSTSGVPDIFT